MTTLSGQTLVVAIQAVDSELRNLHQEITAAVGPDRAGLQALLVSYARAAEELKEAYLDVLEPGTNLPPYPELVGRG